MLTRRIALVALCAMGLGCAQLSLAQNAQGGPPPDENGAGGFHGGRGPGGPGGPEGGALRELNLTAAQKEQIHGVMESFHPQMQALRAREETDRDALRAAPPGTAEATARSQTLEADHREERALRHQVEERIKPILTPEQLAQLKSLRESHREMRSDRAGGRSLPPDDQR
jgi:Spy/CpxP family protein refolding chaperone